MHHRDGESTHQFEAEIAVGNAVNAVHARLAEAQFLGFEGAVGVVSGSGERTRANRTDIHPLHRVGDPLFVALEHGAIGQQMLRESDGLGSLQMGVARQNRIDVLFRHAHHRLDNLAKQFENLVAFVAQIKSQVKCHLIVAASRRVKFFSHIANAPCQFALDEHVNVLAFLVDFEFSAFNFSQNSAQTIDDYLTFVLRNDALLGQHFGMNDGTGYVLSEHPTVEANRGVKLVGNLVERPFEAASPQFFHDFQRQRRGKPFLRRIVAYTFELSP